MNRFMKYEIKLKDERADELVIISNVFYLNID